MSAFSRALSTMTVGVTCIRVIGLQFESGAGIIILTALHGLSHSLHKHLSSTLEQATSTPSQIVITSVAALTMVLGSVVE